MDALSISRKKASPFCSVHLLQLFCSNIIPMLSKRSPLIFSVRIIVDLIVLIAAFIITFGLRFDFHLSGYWTKRIIIDTPYIVILEYVAMIITGATRGAWRYTSQRDALRLIIANGIAAACMGIVHFICELVLDTHPGAVIAIIPWSVIFFNLVLASCGTILVRYMRRFTHNYFSRRRTDKTDDLPKTEVRKPLNVLLIGAGEIGSQVAETISQNHDLRYQPIGFLDDDPAKIGREIYGIRVLGKIDDLGEMAQLHNVEQVILTMSNKYSDRIRSIVSLCNKYHIPAKIIPKLSEIIEGHGTLNRIRDIAVEDLLHRDPVQLDTDKISAFLTGKRIMVTGAGGSIGSEICRQVIGFNPDKLLLLERSEFFLYSIDRELSAHPNGKCIRPVLADITDADHLETIFEAWKPDIIFHAAAHKHVPMLERNPGESIRNNVYGTKFIADVALKFGCEAFVMISTDKAVNPTSVMGTSKRIAELYVQSLTGKGKTRFCAVRFGNVLGSTGSVVPLFKEQIDKGGPLTVTHPDMIRYFMTIPEAAQLVMQAGTMGKGGEIFVLDMGKPVKIVDMAKDMIRLSGHSEEEIPIVFTGCRPGEKLFEELGFDAEKMDKTGHPKIFVGKLQPHDPEQIHQGLLHLREFENSTDNQAVREAMRQLVPEMQVPEAYVRPEDVNPEC